MQFLPTARAIFLNDCPSESICEIVTLSARDRCVCFMLVSSLSSSQIWMIRSYGIPKVNAIEKILEVNAMGNGDGGCI